MIIHAHAHMINALVHAHIHTYTHTHTHTHTQHHSPEFKAILYIIWALPYILAVADVCNVFGYAHRLGAHVVAACGHCRNRGSASGSSDAQETRLLNAITTNHLGHNRRSQILDILSSVLRITTREGAVRSFGETRKGAAAVAVFKERVCDLVEVRDSRICDHMLTDV